MFMEAWNVATFRDKLLTKQDFSILKNIKSVLSIEIYQNFMDWLLSNEKERNEQKKNRETGTQRERYRYVSRFLKPLVCTFILSSPILTPRYTYLISLIFFFQIFIHFFRFVFVLKYFHLLRDNSREDDCLVVAIRIYFFSRHEKVADFFFGPF